MLTFYEPTKVKTARGAYQSAFCVQLILQSILPRSFRLTLHFANTSRPTNRVIDKIIELSKRFHVGASRYCFVPFDQKSTKREKLQVSEWELRLYRGPLRYRSHDDWQASGRRLLLCVDVVYIGSQPLWARSVSLRKRKREDADDAFELSAETYYQPRYVGCSQSIRT